MRSYRQAYPSGGASQSAAYQYSVARLDDPSLNSERLRRLGLSANGSVHRCNNLVAGGNTSASFALHNDLFGEGLLSQSYYRPFLVPYHDIGIYGVAQSDRRRPAATCSQTMISDSGALESGIWISHSQNVHPGHHFSKLFASGTSTNTLSSVPHTVASNALQSRKQPPGSSQALDSVAGRKRKTPPLDALVKETRELHSLFRAGLVADSKRLKSSGNGWGDSRPRMEKHNEMHITNDVVNTRGKWEDRPFIEEEPPSAWKELDAPCKETISDVKIKDSSLLIDMTQEQYAKSVQRSLCRRLKDFIGDSSDDLDSDEECSVDSDDCALNVYDDTFQDLKSREEQAYDFFLQMFEENKDLQKLFNEQCHVGKFECLVCSGMPGKPPKKYSGLISVIMHSSKIIKTKKKQEHRGYARALCYAMGWDICRLPTMPLGSSPNPRCCIPADDEENTGGNKTEEASEERESLKQ